MSKLLSLKMDDEIFRRTEKILKKVKKPRNAYINEAVAKLNRYYERLALKKQLRKEVLALREDNLKILQEFEGLEDLYE